MLNFSPSKCKQNIVMLFRYYGIFLLSDLPSGLKKEWLSNSEPSKVARGGRASYTFSHVNMCVGRCRVWKQISDLGLNVCVRGIGEWWWVGKEKGIPFPLFLWWEACGSGSTMPWYRPYEIKHVLMDRGPCPSMTLSIRADINFDIEIETKERNSIRTAPWPTTKGTPSR